MNKLYLTTLKAALARTRELARDSLRITAIAWQKMRITMLVRACLSLGSGILPFVCAYALGDMLNALARRGQTTVTMQSLWVFAALYAVACLSMPLAQSLQTYLQRSFINELWTHFSLLLAKKRGELDLATHEDAKRQDLLTMIDENDWRLPQFVDRQFLISQNLVEASIAFVLLWGSSPVSAYLLLIAMVLRFLAEARYGLTIERMETKQAEAKRRFWWLRWHFVSKPFVTELKVSQLVGTFVQCIKAILTKMDHERAENEKRNLVWQVLAVLCSQGMVLYAIVTLVQTAWHGNLAVGTLAFLVAAVGSLSAALTSLSQNLGLQYGSSLFVSNTFKLLNLQPIIHESRPGAIVLAPGPVTIRR